MFVFSNKFKSMKLRYALCLILLFIHYIFFYVVWYELCSLFLYCIFNYCRSKARLFASIMYFFQDRNDEACNKIHHFSNVWYINYNLIVGIFKLQIIEIVKLICCNRSPPITKIETKLLKLTEFLKGVVAVKSNNMGWKVSVY